MTFFVTVVADPLPRLVDALDSPGPLPEPLDPGVVLPLLDRARITVIPNEECGFSDSTRTIPETAAELTRKIRRSGLFLFSGCATASQLERLVVDTTTRDPGHAQRLIHVLDEPGRPAQVHVVVGEFGHHAMQHAGAETGP